MLTADSLKKKKKNLLSAINSVTQRAASLGTRPLSHLVRYDSFSASISGSAQGQSAGGRGGHNKFNHLPTGARQKSCKKGGKWITLKNRVTYRKKKTERKNNSSD